MIQHNNNIATMQSSYRHNCSSMYVCTTARVTAAAAVAARVFGRNSEI